MPRGRAKALCKQTEKPNREIIDRPEKELFEELSEDNNYTVNKDVKVKTEPLDEEEPASSGVPDLSQFKFQKKAHVKIEFEKELPTKQEPGLWEPPNWREFLINLKNMRSNNDAPVDSMGCHMAMDENAPPEVMRYQSLIALMLSSQTKDQVTFAAMERLRAKGLTVDNILKISDEELGELIYPVGFWKTKVKYIKKTTQTLKDQYNGDIPDSVEKLCKLTGVGPKMAHICMKVAWNKITGIGVDTHVHRISNRIGWVKKPTPTPEDTRKALQSWLPFELWSEVNHLMVGFGQTICTPISPICNECLNRDICPSSGKGRKSPYKKSPMKQEIKPEESEEEQFEEKKRIPVLKVEPVKPKPKKKVTPKKEIQNFEAKQESKLRVEKDTSKKIFPGNKIKNIDSSNEADMDDFVHAAETIRGSESKLSVNIEDQNDKKDNQNKRLPLKRKSPRNKQISSMTINEKTSDDIDNGKKRTRAAKK